MSQEKTTNVHVYQQVFIINVIVLHGSEHLRLALFPGPAQLSVLQATESWAGPGNEAIFKEVCGDPCVNLRNQF